MSNTPRKPGGRSVADGILMAIADGVARVRPPRTEKSVMRMNAEADPTYRPYCMRCPRLTRMRVLERFVWGCDTCGATHDERIVDKAAGR